MNDLVLAAKATDWYRGPSKPITAFRWNPKRRTWNLNRRRHWALQGKVQTVIIAKLDRLTRSVKDLAE
jgi:hypothetical protein